MFTASQIAWAASHDWFVEGGDEGSIVVADHWVDKDGRSFKEIKVWTDSFAELRRWAGY